MHDVWLLSAKKPIEEYFQSISIILVVSKMAEAHQYSPIAGTCGHTTVGSGQMKSAEQFISI